MTRAQPSSPSAERDRACDLADHCVTCGDVAVSMRVLAIDHASGLADCADEAGRRATVEIALVLPVELEDMLLVHAGTAIARAGAVEPIPAAPGRGSTVEMPEADAEGKVFRAGAVEPIPAAPGRGSTLEMPEADAEGKVFRAGAEEAAGL